MLVGDGGHSVVFDRGVRLLDIRNSANLGYCSKAIHPSVKNGHFRQVGRPRRLDKNAGPCSIFDEVVGVNFLNVLPKKKGKIV